MLTSHARSQCRFTAPGFHHPDHGHQPISRPSKQCDVVWECSDGTVLLVDFFFVSTVDLLGRFCGGLDYVCAGLGWLSWHRYHTHWQNEAQRFETPCGDMEVVPSMIWIDIGRVMCETSQHCSNLGGFQLHVSHSIELQQ